jgi:hypothetical protein
LICIESARKLCQRTSMKRVTRNLLGLLILATSLEVQAQFRYTNADGSIYGYSTNSDGLSLTITGYAGPPWAVSIPTNIAGLTVTAIGDTAFGDDPVTSVIIPVSVTTLGSYAFGACLSVTNVTVIGNITNMGEGVFINSSVTSATVSSTGPFEFNGCGLLTNVTIAFGTTTIESNCFVGDFVLNDVSIPATVTNIDGSAFWNCQGLSHIFFSGNAPTVDPTVFAILGQHIVNGSFVDFVYYVTTAYYLPGTTGWDQFSSNTLIFSNNPNIFGRPLTTNIFIPAVLWNPVIQAGGPSFGVQSNQFGFDITGTTNIPIVVEACTDLALPFWLPLQSLTLTNGLVHFSEPAQSNSPARFYRIGAP